MSATRGAEKFVVTHASAKAGRGQGPMPTVLLIESEPANLIALGLILRSFGYTVLEADSPDEELSRPR